MLIERRQAKEEKGKKHSSMARLDLLGAKIRGTKDPCVYQEDIFFT